ncbi:hypothetical protein AVEN_133749-1 [Araneus ventricosus]|uniref:Uncharacterized protein n=1 Tax=Araneus ventricosus TaxID=182803 RepID=A0A4Y2BAH3_ARAVE|nr:hypothetical protein AVEN_133749-1 [Araneus ventricosus]
MAHHIVGFGLRRKVHLEILPSSEIPCQEILLKTKNKRMSTSIAFHPFAKEQNRKKEGNSRKSSKGFRRRHQRRDRNFQKRFNFLSINGNTVYRKPLLLQNRHSVPGYALKDIRVCLPLPFDASAKRFVIDWRK